MDQEKAKEKEMLTKKYYKKMGMWHEEKEGNPGTHYICDADLLDKIFNDFADTIREKESEIEKLKKEMERKRKEYNQNLDLWKRKYEGEAKVKIYEADQKMEKAEIKAAENENLCKTLLRINKENANAKRKIKPKKEHFGYIVKERETYNYLYSGKMDYEDYFEDKMKLFRVTVQTPYSVVFQEKDALNLVLKDLGSNKIDLGKNYYFKKEVFEISLKANLTELYEDDYKAIQKGTVSIRKKLENNHKYRSMKEIMDDCCIFEARMKTNSREGFWEIIFVTNFEPILNNNNYPFTTEEITDLNPTGTDESF